MSEPRRVGFTAEGRPQSSRGRSRELAPPVQQQREVSCPGAPVGQMESLVLGIRTVARGAHSPGSGSSPESRGSGGGNGNGGGSPPGQRGTARGSQRRDGYVESRNDNVVKKGTSGEVVTLLTNFFQVQRRKGAGWRLYKHRLDYEPMEERRFMQKVLLREAKPQLKIDEKKYQFDGQHLYMVEPLEPALAKVKNKEEQEYTLTLKMVEELNPTDPMYIQFFNILLKSIQCTLELTEMDGKYFDHREAISIPEYNLEVWPGFITTLKQHESQLLLCVDLTHKVLRTDDVLTVMNGVRERVGTQDPARWKGAIADELVGTVVMTTYNRKTYRVDDIDWSKNPTHKFSLKGQEVSFMDYMKTKYNIQSLRSKGQPLLVSNPKARDIHGGVAEPILLIPELCRMTGLNDAMLSDFQQMRRLAEHLQAGPQTRMDTICKFVNRIISNTGIVEELRKWNLRIPNAEPVQIPGRIMPKPEILFGNQGKVEPDHKADWTMAFRNQKFLSSTNLTNWVVILPDSERANLDNLIRNLMQVGTSLNFNISDPLEKVGIGAPNPRSYSDAIRRAVDKYGNGLNLIFVILPNNKLDNYAAVKQATCVDYGIPSQCFLAKKLRSKGLMSIATKVVVQLNAKLGGEPWSVKIPLKKMMVVGFDVYHGGQAVGAMCATFNGNFTKYFSTTSKHSSDEELSKNLCVEFTKCLNAYQKMNKVLPERVVFYRDGVGQGQLPFVYEQELEQLKASMNSVYAGANMAPPLFTFIVVFKRINTRIFAKNNNRIENPTPGTVVDDVVTLPERYDFFMVPAGAGQGTVSPTSFNVLHDTSGLPADRIQQLSYRLCHLYYNWSGATPVPAPVVYAHKLALLSGSGSALSSGAHGKLAALLYFM